MGKEIKVLEVLLNEMPQNCGECPLMYYVHDTTPVCHALPEDVREITGNPYDMKYCRSDCPAVADMGY